ncbi:mitochondrial ribosomal small subunit component [Diaporthe eres]|uniref:Mitochondrial ribosomal small subunit component n=1 Tax=Diaporthe eres TaxID=83184 RepID=A0ABR1P816_DIAER
MLYEMIGIVSDTILPPLRRPLHSKFADNLANAPLRPLQVRPGNLAEVKEIVLAAGQLVLRNGGVVRSVDNWGVFALPRAVSKNQALHHNGHYFAMRYDASAAAQGIVRRTINLDPRVIRSTSVKLGDGKLESLSRFGQISWANSAL